MKKMACCRRGCSAHRVLNLSAPRPLRFRAGQGRAGGAKRSLHRLLHLQTHGPPNQGGRMAIFRRTGFGWSVRSGPSSRRAPHCPKPVSSTACCAPQTLGSRSVAGTHPLPVNPMALLQKVFGIDFTPADGGAFLFRHLGMPGGKAMVNGIQKTVLQAHIRKASTLTVWLLAVGFVLLVLGKLADNGGVIFLPFLLCGALIFWHLRAVQRIALPAHEGASAAPAGATQPTDAQVAAARKVLLGFALVCVALAVLGACAALLSQRSFYVVAGSVGGGLSLLLALVFAWAWNKARPSA